jgi:hypothetical protein
LFIENPVHRDRGLDARRGDLNVTYFPLVLASQGIRNYQE